MAGLAFIISIVALVLAYLAYRQSGGAADLQAKVEQLGITTETLREKLADSLGRLEKAVRGVQAKPATPEDQQQQEPK
jgi:hypothetical protein